MKNLVSLVLCLLLASSLCGEWSVDPQNPSLIAAFDAEQVLPKVAITPDGHTYVCRFDNGGGMYKVWLQLLSPTGEYVWPAPAGILVSGHNQMSWLTEYALTVDNDQNAVITFQDIRNSEVNNVLAYKINPAGDFLWGANGIALTQDTDPNYSNMSPVIFNSADNSCYVAWQRLGATTAIGINRLSATGEKLWGENVLSISETEGSLTWPQIIQADGNNILLKYFHDTGPFWAPTRTVYVAKYTPEGSRLWTAVVTNQGGIPAWEQLIPFEPDGQGGCVLAWYEDRDMNDDNDVYVQRICSDGTASMPANGVLLSVDSVNQQFYPKLSVDPASERIYAYFRITDAIQGQFGLARQLVDYSGNRLWGDIAPNIIDLGTMEVNSIAAYQISTGSVVLYGRGDNLYASHWRSNGNMGWNEATCLASTAVSKGHFDVAVHPDEWSVLAWEQGYSSMDIGAMRLNPDGSLGIYYPAPANVTYTQPTTYSVLLTWTQPSQYLAPDSYHIYMNSELLQEVEATANSYLVSPLLPGTYTFYLKAKYGDHYSQASESVTVNILANSDDLQPASLGTVMLYPNPTRGLQYLQFDIDKQVSMCNISIYNIKGQKLLEYNPDIKLGINKIELDKSLLKGLNGGVYLVSLRLDEQVRTLKTVILP